MKRHILLVHDGDTMTCIADDAVDGQAFGVPVRRRASHIWPACPFKRVAFRCLRLLFGDTGRVGAWTRTWLGDWQVRWANDRRHIAFTHPSRRVCLDWERGELNHKLSGA